MVFDTAHESTPDKSTPVAESVKRNNDIRIVLRICVLCALGLILLAIYIMYFGTNEIETTTKNTSPGDASDSGSGGPYGVVTRATTTVAPKTQDLGPTTQESDTDGTPAGGYGGSTVTKTTTDTPRTQNSEPTSEDASPRDTSSGGSGGSSVTFVTMATTKAGYQKPMSNRTLLCTFGTKGTNDTVWPQDGLCDIIIFDYFYYKGKDTFLDSSSVSLKWALDFVKNSYLTEFGIAVHETKLVDAYQDLSKPDGIATTKHFWSMNIRHYGLLHFSAHSSLTTDRSKIDHYIQLLKRLRTLQNINRAGDFNHPGYIILGIGLYAPRTVKVYDYLDELLGNAPIDAVVLLTYIRNMTQGDCKITGPSVYRNATHRYQVSIVDALDYAQSRQAKFSGMQLMVSFTMAAFWGRPLKKYDEQFPIGKDCAVLFESHMNSVCLTYKMYIGNVVPDLHVMMHYNASRGVFNAYDNDLTIKWKICSATKQHPNLQFGVALFYLEYEDGQKLCLHKGSDFRQAAGYYRLEATSKYMKNVIRDPGFFTKNISC